MRLDKNKMSEADRAELKSIRAELRILTDERRELLREYRYYKRKEYKLLEKYK